MQMTMRSGCRSGAVQQQIRAHSSSIGHPLVHVRIQHHPHVLQASAVAPNAADADACHAQPAAAEASRRQLLLASVSGVVTSLIAYTQAAAADELGGLDLEKQLPGLPPVPPGDLLPKAYQRTMHKLVRALRESIESEAAGAKEFEVRRKADGAKDLVKEFVGKWQDNAAVVGDITHTEMKDALSELGRFYQSKGPRARLSADVRDSVLAHLAAVEAGLPEEEKSLLGF